MIYILGTMILQRIQAVLKKVTHVLIVDYWDTLNSNCVTMSLTNMQIIRNQLSALFVRLVLEEILIISVATSMAT